MTRRRPALTIQTCRLCGFRGTRGITFVTCRHRGACERRQAKLTADHITTEEPPCE